eukprot:PITA_31779
MLLKMSIDYIIPHIRECKSIGENWGILKDLYEIRNTNHLLFLKSKILSLKMEENETIVSFIARIKDLKNKLADIFHTAEDTYLVTITMNGVTDDYQMFITWINAREKILKFEELIGILMQEEERSSTLKPQSVDLPLMVKKNFYKGSGNLQQQNKGSSQKIPNQTQERDEHLDVDIWYVDSGASTHMIGNKQWFEYFKEINDGAQIYLADDKSPQIKGCGEISVILPNGNVRQIYNVMYVPSITNNFIYVSMIADQDLKVEFFKSNFYIKGLLDGLKTIATGIRTGGLYKLDVRPALVRALIAVGLTTEELWHQIFGHINYNDLLLLQKKEMFRNIIEKITWKKIQILRFDQGGEYRKDELIKYFKDHGILQQFTVPNTPQQNGVIERKNRTLVECARSMLKARNLSNGFWVEALNTAIYLKNRSPMKSLEFKTPYETLYGFKSVVKHSGVFGSKSFSHISKEDRRKLDSKSIRLTFIGYCSQYKSYRLFNPSTHKIFVSRDVIFHEKDHEESDKKNEEWDIPYLVEEESEEIGNNQDQQQTKAEDEKQQQ